MSDIRSLENRINKLKKQIEPKPKHDGKLDKDGKIRVFLTGDDGEEFRGKRQVVIIDEAYDGIGLSLAQARELMAWLEQERDAGRLEQ